MPRRTDKEIRKLILKNLSKKNLAINEIASLINSTWKTAMNHIIYLKGMEFIIEIFSHKRLRIFEITKKGKEFIK